MSREEIEMMIRAMEEHLDLAQDAHSPDLIQAIEDALQVLEQMASAASSDDEEY